MLQKPWKTASILSTRYRCFKMNCIIFICGITDFSMQFRPFRPRVSWIFSVYASVHLNSVVSSQISLSVNLRRVVTSRYAMWKHLLTIALMPSIKFPLLAHVCTVLPRTQFSLPQKHNFCKITIFNLVVTSLLVSNRHCIITWIVTMIGNFFTEVREQPTGPAASCADFASSNDAVRTVRLFQWKLVIGGSIWFATYTCCVQRNVR